MVCVGVRLWRPGFLCSGLRPAAGINGCLLLQEEQLEREKQQQLVLLQELQEQKDKLEQLLLEAQQERENLKAAATPEFPVKQPEPVKCEVSPSYIMVGSNSLYDGHSCTVCLQPADHSRRLREFQQRLLQQSRCARVSIMAQLNHLYHVI